VEKLLPQNIEAECGVLGSIIIDPEAIVQVSDFLHADDFYRDAHRTIYEVILQLYEEHEPADFITICDELERQNKLEEVGGASYITSLINQVPTSGNVEFYARIVERTAILRRLIHAAGQIAAIAYEEGDADIALDKAEQLIFNISQRHSRSDFAHVRDILAEYMNKLDQLHERRGAIVGVPTGFTDLDRLTGGLQKSDLIVLAARPGIGKCLTANTLIDNPETGERLTIEECVRRHLTTVYGLSEEGKMRTTSITDWIDSGIQSCYRVTTGTGRMVEVTGHHPFLTVNGWTPLHDIGVGQSIAVPKSVETFGTDESWSLDMVRLLAYFIAEGGLTNSSPYFTNADPEIVEDFKQIIASHFPECVVKQYQISYAVVQPRNQETMRGGAIFPKNRVTLWLDKLGLKGKLAKDKFFPPCVWMWSRRYLVEFVRTLMSCDGSIYSSHGYPRIEFCVASRKLAADLHHAFIRFGIVSKFYRTSQGAWRVEITSPESVESYQRQIGWLGEKKARFADYTHITSLRGGNQGHAPQAVWELVCEAAKLQGLSMVELARRGGETTKSGKYGGYNAHKKRSLPRYRLAAYAEVLNSTTLRRFASPDIYWDEIVSIEPIGEHQVYDLTVPDGENFIAQDIFVHNSSLALSLAHNSALKYHNSIAVFSLEMSKDQLAQRLLSMDAGIDQQRLRTGVIEDDEWDRIVYAMDTLAEANIWIDDTAGISTIEMRSKARRLQAEHGIDLIIVDYLQLMQATIGGKRNENRVQEISEISRSLKGLARELDIPVLALAQLSRAVESRQSKVPQLSDLRESGCVTGETLVYMPDAGTYKPIEQLVSQTGFRVLALNTETWKLEPCQVSRAFATGYKPVYRITTRLGRTIRATANHQFLTISGWQPLDQLTPGTRIALPRRMPGPVQASMSDAELALLGHLIGDGCTLPSHAIQYTTRELELAEIVVSLATAVFGGAVAPRISKERGWYQVYFPPSFHLTHGVHNPIVTWLSKMGIFGLRSYEKRVPDVVFAQPPRAIACFLRHLWSTDGCINLSQRQKHYASIYYASSSVELVRQVQSLLLRLEINAILSRHAQVGKGRDQYHITVSGKTDIERFIDQIGTLSLKKLMHQTAISDSLALTYAKTNRDVLPHEAWQLFVIPAMQTIGLATGQMQVALGWKHSNRGIYGQNLSRERAIRVAQIVGSKQLERLAHSDVYWDKIISIEPHGEAEVYDLTVDEHHNFIAGDIVTHNSIEQDSDIVMFIYRDDLYNQDSERKNIADIIIAKHRNGPIGEISLYFQASQTRFRDLELNPSME
jgi:replicative DNA helicase